MAAAAQLTSGLISGSLGMQAGAGMEVELPYYLRDRESSAFAFASASASLTSASASGSGSTALVLPAVTAHWPASSSVVRYVAREQQLQQQRAKRAGRDRERGKSTSTSTESGAAHQQLPDPLDYLQYPSSHLQRRRGSSLPRTLTFLVEDTGTATATGTSDAEDQVNEEAPLQDSNPTSSDCTNPAPGQESANEPTYFFPERSYSIEVPFASAVLSDDTLERQQTQTQTTASTSLVSLARQNSFASSSNAPGAQMSEEDATGVTGPDQRAAQSRRVRFSLVEREPSSGAWSSLPPFSADREPTIADLAPLLHTSRIGGTSGGGGGPGFGSGPEQHNGAHGTTGHGHHAAPAHHNSQNQNGLAQNNHQAAVSAAPDHHNGVNEAVDSLGSPTPRTSGAVQTANTNSVLGHLYRPPTPGRGLLRARTTPRATNLPSLNNSVY